MRVNTYCVYIKFGNNVWFWRWLFEDDEFLYSKYQYMFWMWRHKGYICVFSSTQGGTEFSASDDVIETFWFTLQTMSAECLNLNRLPILHCALHLLVDDAGLHILGVYFETQTQICKRIRGLFFSRPVILYFWYPNVMRDDYYGQAENSSLIIVNCH